MVFTGIVQEKARLLRVKKLKDFSSIEIESSLDFMRGIKIGASVSIDGVCLTVKKGATDLLEFDVITETLDRTNFKLLRKGNKVNLERSMQANTEIGGHLVSGHIHGVGVIKSINDRGKTKDIRIQPPASLMEYLFYKGYVGLNGCSLTIGKVFKSAFDIHLIPETIKVTNFQKMKKGDLINIEIDQTTINTVETIKKIMLERKV